MSVTVEASILGAAMLSDRAADVMADRVSDGMWTRDAHRTVAAAITKLRGEGLTADLASVTDALGGRLEEVGGPVALYDLTAHTPGTAQVGQWCEAVVDAYRRRRLDGVLAQLRADLADSGVATDDLVEAAVAEMTAVGDGGRVVDPEMLLRRFGERVTSGVPQAGWRMPWQQMGWWRLPDDGLTVVTGLPTAGKSTWLDVLVASLLRENEDLRVAFFSPEMSPPDHHMLELARTLMGGDPRGDAQKAKGWGRWLTERCFWIDDDRDSSPGAVLAQARRLSSDRGVRLLVVDPYNNLEPDSSHGDRQDLYIQSLLRRYRRFARASGVAVVMVAHPRKMEKIPGTDAVYRVPGAGDIAGGQEWWNHADSVLSVWRNSSGEHIPGEPDYPPWQVRVTVSKVRFGKWGRTGQATLKFDEHARRYE